jgi:hypothetical protein
VEDSLEVRLRAILCCCADDHTVGQGGEHINLVQLDKLAEWPFMTAMNVLVPESKDHSLASAVVCDRCIAEGREILYAVKGEPGPDGEAVYTRVPVSELKKPDFYWPDHHPDQQLEEAYEEMALENQRISEELLPFALETLPPYEE